MKKNQRGEITLAILIAVAVGSLFVGMITPKISPFKNFFGSSDSAVGKKASYTTQVEKIKPKVYHLNKAGDVVIVNDVELSYNTGIDQNVPKPTLGQRIGSFFFGLTTWSIIFIIVSLLFFGGAPLLWIARKYFVMKQAAINTVAGIRELKSKEPEAYQKLVPILAANHDKQDKVVVDKIKTELNK